MTTQKADRVAAVRLYAESPADAALDTALSHALLRRALADEEALRLWTPPPAMSFGKLDLLSPTHERAIAAARARGLTPVRRLAGGRVAPVGAGAVCVGWASSSSEIADLQWRYETLAATLLSALAKLGVNAGVGELDGEWCPGSWSILVDQAKVAGLAQRVIRGGAWAEAVLFVEGSEQLRRQLDDVQRALGVRWAPATLGALTDTKPELTVRRVTDVLAIVLTERFAAALASLPEAIWIEAERLGERHVL